MHLRCDAQVNVGYLLGSWIRPITSGRLAGSWEYFLLQVSSRLWLAVWETRKLGTATAIVVRLDKVKNILLLSFLSIILG
jgi:hypothetical protein